MRARSGALMGSTAADTLEVAPTGVEDEQKEQMKSDTSPDAMTSPKVPTNQVVEVGNEAEEPGGGSSSSEQVPEPVMFSPGFSSAAALAGWDADTLLMAALCGSPIDSGTGHGVPSPSEANRVEARKRDKRTPLSSARRHRRFRLEDKNGSPVGRLPMKPFTLLSGNEEESGIQANKSPGRFSGAEGKENCSHGLSTCKEGKGKSKSKQVTPEKGTPAKPLCIDQLREELTCAICLDICFEPSTVSCGHSFCGTCLQSVLQKCGPRCPKCRQPLRSETLRNYQVNTVLWNTIQILFPKESAQRIQDKQTNLEKEASNKAPEEEPQYRRPLGTLGTLGTRPSRMQPWRSSAFIDLSRINVVGNLTTSFQAASEMLMPPTSERLIEVDWRMSERRDTQARVITQDRERPQRSRSRSRRQIQANQEQMDAALAARLQQAESVQQATQESVDAALAARLQQAELNAGSGQEDLLVVEGREDGSRVLSRPPMRPSLQHAEPIALLVVEGREDRSRLASRPSGRQRLQQPEPSASSDGDDLSVSEGRGNGAGLGPPARVRIATATAAANLRNVASRATRQRRPRMRS